MIRGVCAAAGCKNIAVNKSRCELHQHKIQPKTAQATRSSTTVNDHIYQSTKWRKLRDRKFKQNPICEHCIKYNKITPTDVIDHIIPILDDESLAYVYNNLQGLCNRCHNTKTAKETADRKTTKTLTASDLFNQLKSTKEKKND